MKIAGLKFLFRKLNNWSLGRRGESVARRYLIRNNYKIWNTNWRKAFGEIDLIASEGGVLIFVEVKTRRLKARSCFPAADAVDFKKQRQIEKLAASYLHFNRHLLKINKIREVRFDVIGVTYSGPFSVKLEHRIAAFT